MWKSVRFLVRDRSGAVNLENRERRVDASADDEFCGETSEYIIF
jgi:hypothetical protein